MRIIKRKQLIEFWDQHQDVKKPLLRWYKMVKTTIFSNFRELNKTFPSADIVGNCTVFNIVGNKYRIIARVNYKIKTIFIGYVLTHSDYDKGIWKMIVNNKDIKL